LYWGWQGDAFLFGSELKALREHPEFRYEIDRNSLALFFRYNYIPSPYSIYQGIKKLCAGHYVSVRFDDKGVALPVESKPYWSMNKIVKEGGANPFVGTQEEAVNALENQLSLSIGQQMLSDVPLGAFLSGGVDSSTVVALMQKQSSTPVRTFTIGFDEPGYNEAEHAKAVAGHLGTEHTELYVSAVDAISVISQLPEIYCEPFADSSQIPTFLVSQLAKKHVTVALSGDGGDELFGGYNPYQFAPPLWNRISRLPLSVRKLIATTLSGIPAPDKVRKLFSVLDAPCREELYRCLVSHWQDPSCLVVGAVEPPSLLNTPEAWPETDCFEHWMMAMDTQIYMADDILVKVDRAAMANSLETRVPMLDHRVVELAWSMPLSLKIREGNGKWLLREVLKRHVPREMIERPKKGFSVPLAAWLRGPLRAWAEALLDKNRLIHEGYFHSAPIQRKWREHKLGMDHSRLLWSILMFQAWLDDQKT
jgi:asparagine synthase (glutamine-hydrolysing)